MSFSPTNKDSERLDERTNLLHQEQNHNDNALHIADPSYNYKRSEPSWAIDPATKYFAILMFVIVVILTTILSVMANRDADDSPPRRRNLGYSDCFAYRTFTLWKTWAGVTNASSAQQREQKQTCVGRLGLVRGAPVSCTSSLECQLNIPRYCLYGDPKFLVCHRRSGFCSLKTASLPVSLEDSGAGVCPVIDNTTDRCGDLIGSDDDENNVAPPPNQEAIATKPVVCVTTKVCSEASGISCHALYPNKTQ